MLKSAAYPFNTINRKDFLVRNFRCHFHFNGKENDDEVKGTGNSIEYGARMYDSRLGKWLSVDNRFSKYPDLSPYVYAENNPLIMLDQGGDSTIYYTQGGIRLSISHDNLENAIVIVDDKQLFRWAKNMQGFKAKGVSDNAVANEHLRKMGTVFLVKPLDNFFKINSKANALKEGNLDGIKIDHLEKDGKSIPLFGEVKGNLIQNGNTVTVGKNINFGGLAGSTSPDYESNKIGTIHTHTYNGDYQMVGSNSSSRPVKFFDGFSPADINAAAFETTVAVDKKSIYISTKDKDIKFDKKNGFKR